MLSFNGDLCYFYPTPERERELIRMLQFHFHDMIQTKKELNKMGINLFEEYWFLYLPVCCDKIQVLIDSLTENDYRAPKNENTYVGPQLFERFMEDFEQIESLRKT